MATPESTVRAERLLQLLYKRTVVVLDVFRQLKIPQTRPLEIELAIICKEAEKTIKNGKYLDHFKYDPSWENSFLKRKSAELIAKRKKPPAIKLDITSKPKEEPPKADPVKEDPKTPVSKGYTFTDLDKGRVKVDFGNGTYKIMSKAKADQLRGISSKPLAPPAEPAPVKGTGLAKVVEPKAGSVVKKVGKNPKIAPPK